LRTRIDNFQNKMDLVMRGPDCEDIWDGGQPDCDDQSLEMDEDNGSGVDDYDHHDDQEDEGTEATPPEQISLSMPSSLELSDLHRLDLMGLANQELQLRKGQANDALEKLRLALGHEALLFRTDVGVECNDYTLPLTSTLDTASKEYFRQIQSLERSQTNQGSCFQAHSHLSAVQESNSEAWGQQRRAGGLSRAPP
jgi:hypothetical protein